MAANFQSWQSNMDILHCQLTKIIHDITILWNTLRKLKLNMHWEGSELEQEVAQRKTFSVAVCLT